MAINSNYFINAATLDLATSVYLDLELTNIAPDGYYGNGSISRQQSSGILLTDESCLSPCPASCRAAISGVGSSGIYQINVDVGDTTTGAIIIIFNPDTVPSGIRAVYDGVVYNKLSSPSNGYLQSPNSGHFTIVGSSGSTGTCTSWYPGGQTQTNTVYQYSPATSLFVNTGTTQVDVISPAPNADFFIESGVMGDCVMVIPKPNATPSVLFIEMIGPCTSGSWTFSTACPIALSTFFTSSVFPTSSIPCGTAIDAPKWYAQVHTAVDGYVGISDYVFTDENGQFPLADGYYLTDAADPSNKVIYVVNGIVKAITNCI